MRIAFVLMWTVLGFTYSPISQAWGKFGHLTVCDLAYRNLTPTSRQALQDLLHSRTSGILVKGRGALPDRTYTSFNMGCLEEDELPRKHPADHFINVDRDTTSISSTQCPGGAQCILSGIQRDFDVLRDTSKPDEERVFSLMALGHWLGDIHQPLHVSFADDRGGNSILVQMQGRCGSSGSRPKNLHAVWDNCLLEAGIFERVRKRADFNPSWQPRTITYRAVDTLQANTSLEEEKSFVEGDPAAWADESYQFTLQPDASYCVKHSGDCQYSSTSSVYVAPNKRTQKISAAYINAYSLVVEDRVRRAGFRLADLINKALDPAYTGPVANSSQRP